MIGLTASGKARFDYVTTYHLDEFYQAEMGNIVIANDLFDEFVLRCVLIFLKDNPDWVLGYEQESKYWYLNTLEELKES